eukprot:Rmarinus@m.68
MKSIQRAFPSTRESLVEPERYPDLIQGSTDAIELENNSERLGNSDVKNFVKFILEVLGLQVNADNSDGTCNVLSGFCSRCQESRHQAVSAASSIRSCNDILGYNTSLESLLGPSGAQALASLVYEGTNGDCSRSLGLQNVVDRCSRILSGSLCSAPSDPSVRSHCNGIVSSTNGSRLVPYSDVSVLDSNSSGENRRSENVEREPPRSRMIRRRSTKFLFNSQIPSDFEPDNEGEEISSQLNTTLHTLESEECNVGETLLEVHSNGHIQRELYESDKIVPSNHGIGTSTKEETVEHRIGVSSPSSSVCGSSMFFDERGKQIVTLGLSKDSLEFLAERSEADTINSMRLTVHGDGNASNDSNAASGLCQIDRNHFFASPRNSDESNNPISSSHGHVPFECTPTSPASAVLTTNLQDSGPSISDRPLNSVESATLSGCKTNNSTIFMFTGANENNDIHSFKPNRSLDPLQQFPCRSTNEHADGSATTVIKLPVRTKALRSLSSIFDENYGRLLLSRGEGVGDSNSITFGGKSPPKNEAPRSCSDSLVTTTDGRIDTAVDDVCGNLDDGSSRSKCVIGCRIRSGSTCEDVTLNRDATGIEWLTEIHANWHRKDHLDESGSFCVQDYLVSAPLCASGVMTASDNCKRKNMGSNPDIETNLGRIGLDFSRVPITYSRAENLRSEIVAFQNLTHVILVGCDINNVIVGALATAFSRAPNLTFLDLSENPLGDDGTRVVAVNLPYYPKCESLRMADSGLSSEGLRELSYVLPATSVTELDVSCNSIGDAGVESFAKILPDSALTNVSLSCVGLCDGGASALAKVLPDSRLHYLDLQYNGIRLDGAYALAQSLASCSSLYFLGVKANRIPPEGVEMLFGAGYKMLLIQDENKNEATEHTLERLTCSSVDSTGVPQEGVNDIQEVIDVGRFSCVNGRMVPLQLFDMKQPPAPEEETYAGVESSADVQLRTPEGRSRSTADNTPLVPLSVNSRNQYAVDPSASASTVFDLFGLPITDDEVFSQLPESSCNRSATESLSASRFTEFECRSRNLRNHTDKSGSVIPPESIQTTEVSTKSYDNLRADLQYNQQIAVLTPFPSITSTPFDIPDKNHVLEDSLLSNSNHLISEISLGCLNIGVSQGVAPRKVEVDDGPDGVKGEMLERFGAKPAAPFTEDLKESFRDADDIATRTSDKHGLLQTHHDALWSPSHDSDRHPPSNTPLESSNIRNFESSCCSCSPLAVSKPQDEMPCAIPRDEGCHVDAIVPKGSEHTLHGARPSSSCDTLSTSFCFAGSKATRTLRRKSQFDIEMLARREVTLCSCESENSCFVPKPNSMFIERRRSLPISLRESHLHPTQEITKSFQPCALTTSVSLMCANGETQASVRSFEEPIGRGSARNVGEQILTDRSDGSKVVGPEIEEATISKAPNISCTAEKFHVWPSVQSHVSCRASVDEEARSRYIWIDKDGVKKSSLDTDWAMKTFWSVAQQAADWLGLGGTRREEQCRRRRESLSAPSLVKGRDKEMIGADLPHSSMLKLQLSGDSFVSSCLDVTGTSTLLELHLDGCALSDSEVPVLCQTLSTTVALDTLWLRQNLFTPQGWIQLITDGFCFLNLLRVLDLSQNNLGRSGGEILVKYLRASHPPLQYLSLSKTSVPPGVIASLFDESSMIPTLRIFALSELGLADSFCEMVQSKLHTLRALQVIDLSENEITSDGAMVLLQGFTDDVIVDLCGNPIPADSQTSLLQASQHRLRF